MTMLDEYLRSRGQLISLAIDEFLPLSKPTDLYEATRHLLSAGGKRLRPCMLMLAGETVGGDPSTLAPAAVSIELIHNFTLVHDDIMDNAYIRRGLKAVHTIWGTAGAILAGDTLYSKAFETLGKTSADRGRVLDALNIMSWTCTAICEGQWRDMEFENREVVSEAEYFEMVEKKTGVLFGAAASMGAVLSGASAEESQAMGEFGRLTGMAFQIQDDLLDLLTSENILGKKRGGDIIEGKKTLLMIHAIRSGVKVEAFGKKDAQPEEIDRALEALENSGSINYARSKAVELLNKGKSTLDIIPDSKDKKLLLSMADYMINRDY